MRAITVEHLSFAAEGKDILKDISLQLDGHQFTALIVPNGSGKSTLLKHIYRLLPIQSGQIYLDNTPLSSIGLNESAKRLGVMSQFNRIDFDFTVWQIAMMGRIPYKKSFEGTTDYDEELVRSSLDRVGMLKAADRRFNSLSGGEQQRVMLARVLVQEPEFLILDEPTNHLDITYQLKILDIVKDLSIGIVAALHDLNLAAMYSDFIYVMKEGRIVARGAPKEVINEALINAIYDVKSHVVLDKAYPTVTYHRPKRQALI